jgi:predicted PurR-regulated permease PerM
VLALVLTIAVLPLRDWAGRHGWPSWLATLFALVAVYLILAVLVFGTAVCLVKLVEVLPQYTGAARDLTDRIEQSLSGLGLDGAATAIETFIKDVSTTWTNIAIASKSASSRWDPDSCSGRPAPARSVMADPPS